VRILYLANSGQIGGGNRSLMMLWAGLRKRGIDVLAVCPNSGPMVDACKKEQIPCEIVEYSQIDLRRPLSSWLSHQKWRRVLQALKPDLIHVNDPYGARSIALAAWQAHLPVVCHIQFPPSLDSISWLFRALPKPNWFIINSWAVEREIGKQLKARCPESGQTVIYNAIDLAEFTSQKNAAHTTPRVGIVANLLPVKGHTDFLCMARELNKREIEAEYWIIGEDIYKTGFKNTLIQQAANLGIRTQVKFLGFCSNVAQVLGFLDIIVSCSLQEPFGISLIEAMACQKPVVGTRVGGIPEVIEDGVTGFLVSPQAPIELADAVGRLVLDPELRKRMGEAGRRRVERLFSQNSHVDQTLSIYRLLSACAN
jgi:glycosyltransferase involved in cell wall biosynthesis